MLVVLLVFIVRVLRGMLGKGRSEGSQGSKLSSSFNQKAKPNRRNPAPEMHQKLQPLHLHCHPNTANTPQLPLLSSFPSRSSLTFDALLFFFCSPPSMKLNDLASHHYF